MNAERLLLLGLAALLGLACDTHDTPSPETTVEYSLGGKADALGATQPPSPLGCDELSIDRSGVVRGDCGIEGEWTLHESQPDFGARSLQLPFDEDRGFCLRGQLPADPSGVSGGSILSFDFDLAFGWNAQAQRVIGFEVEVEGTHSLRVGVDSRASRPLSETAPFVLAQPGTSVVALADAQVPPDWPVANAGETPDPASIHRLSFQVPAQPEASDYEVCLTGITPIVQACEDFADFNANGYTVVNNTWGRGSLRDYEQCIASFGGRKGSTFGWSWDWPLSSQDDRGYPEVIAGHSPWRAFGNGHGLPTPVTSEVAMDFDIEIDADPNGRYKLASEMWLTDSPEPKPESIAYEVMFWLDRNRMDVGGRYLGSLRVDGVAYDAFSSFRRVVGDPRTDGWTYIAFRAQRDVQAGQLRMAPFMDFLIGRGVIRGDEYIADVELGVGMISGSGEARVHAFDVSVVPDE